MVSVADNLRRSINRSSLSGSSISSLSGLSGAVPTGKISMGMGSTDIEEFLLHYNQEHPLIKQGLSDYSLLVKNEDFHLYSVEQNHKQMILKVMCDPDLFYGELEVYKRIQCLSLPMGSEESKFVLQLKQWFQF